MAHTMLGLEHLPWLPPAPPNARRRLRAFTPKEARDELEAFARTRLSAAEAATFGRTLVRCRDAGLLPHTLAPLKLGLLSNATLDIIVDQLPVGAMRHGVALQTVVPPFDQVEQQAFNPASEIHTANLDAILLAIDHRWLRLDQAALDAPQQVVDAAISHLGDVIAALREHGSALPILQTVPVPPEPLFGSFDIRSPGTPRALIQTFNGQLNVLAQTYGAIVFDVAALAERLGTERWFDSVQWAAYKIPFAAGFAPVYADALGALLGAVRGKSRKCLVLDLDNTLWGGVIGDDGMSGIKIGQGSAVGEAHLAVQSMALSLRERGIILAVSSKNDDANARQPFREHPDMLLREEHITVFQANWDDKASNLEAIAASINIGVDALVFLDDNPVERAHMRAALPAVATPELPEDPSLYPRILASAGYFEALEFSKEDKMRVESYAAEAKRAEVKTRSRDLGDYLNSLEMKLTATPFDPDGRPRITQLVNKTNQFNLTTRRYTEAQIKSFEEDSRTATLQVRLRDAFSDFGMIGVIIASSPDDDSAPSVPTWEIDTWLMSCRVLGRKVEQAMLADLAQLARDAGIERLVGVYRPTPKNGMVSGHYLNLGFAECGWRDEGTILFQLYLADYLEPNLPILRGQYNR